MKSNWFVMQLALALVGALMLPAFAFALVDFDAALPVTMTGLDNITITIRANSHASSVSVEPTLLVIEVPLGQRLVLEGPSGYRLQNSSGFSESCEPGKRVLDLNAASEAISTVVTPILASQPCVNQGAPVSSPASGSPSAAPAPAAAAGGGNDQIPIQKPKPVDPKKAVGEFIDISTLSTADIARVLRVVDLMKLKKTYQVPTHHLFSPNTITTAGFAAQIVTAIDGKGCGNNVEYPGVTFCLREAQQRGYLPEGLTIRSRVSRFLFYKALLASLKISADQDTATTKDLKLACKDVTTSTDEVARVYNTAKKNGLTGTYYLRKCQLDLNFSRGEAMRFAAKALLKR